MAMKVIPDMDDHANRTTVSPPGKVDFRRWAVVAHKDDTGLGREAAQTRKSLGIGRHLVVPSVKLTNHSLDETEEAFIEKDASTEKVAQLLEGLQGIIFFERHDWSQHLLTVARKMGVCTVCIPHWEWFFGEHTQWNEVDLLACPHLFTLRVVRKFGWKQAVHLPYPMYFEDLPLRRVVGPARQFVHNAGLVDYDDRKGTRDTILAFRKVKRQDIRLIVRIQKETELPPLDDRIEVQIGNLSSPAELYAEGDVAIQPSKMEGMGFMVLEPVCAGMPVITTDYPPMNEWVRQPEMRCKLQWFRRKAFPTNWVKQAHLRLPSRSDLARRIAWCADNDMARFSQENRQWAEQTFNREELISLWARTLEENLKGLK